MGQMMWTYSEERILRRMWADGRTAQEIADELPGRGRMAVIGKVKRLRDVDDLVPHEDPLPKPPDPPPDPCPVLTGSCIEPGCRSTAQPGRSRCARCHTVVVVSQRETVNRKRGLRND